MTTTDQAEKYNQKYNPISLQKQPEIQYSHLIGDDYCTAKTARHLGSFEKAEEARSSISTKGLLQANTTKITININLNNPLPTDWEVDVGEELRSLSIFAFFPYGVDCAEDLIHCDHELGIDRSDNNRFLVKTDFRSFADPLDGTELDLTNYLQTVAVWMVSENRRALTYSHVDNDL